MRKLLAYDADLSKIQQYAIVWSDNFHQLYCALGFGTFANMAFCNVQNFRFASQFLVLF